MTPINANALCVLRAALSEPATASLPGEAGYSNRRWAGNAEKTAAIVVCPATAEDVVQALAFVQGKAPYESQEKLDLAVKCGGHSMCSSSEGLVIDLEPNMHAVRVDPDLKLAYVGGGSLWRNVDEVVAKYGLAAVAGVVSHTGVGGLTLGGGFGWLSGEHGLVIDNLVGATVVTASGSIVYTSEVENPDLFWALRGGGGNFGVVSEFVFRLHEQRPDLYQASFTFSPTALEVLMTEINMWLMDRSILESGELVLTNGPSNLPELQLDLVYNGDSNEGRQKFARFEKLEPMLHTAKTIPYIELNQLLDAVSPHGDCRHKRGNFIPATSQGIPSELVKNTFDLWLKITQDHPAAINSLIIWELYSPEKWSKVPSDATAYVHRKPAYNLNSILRWSDPVFAPHAVSASRAIDKVFLQTRAKYFAPEAVGEGGYINYLDEEARKSGEDVLLRRFGSNYMRLVEVKTKYDPDNIFNKWFRLSAKLSA